MKIDNFYFVVEDLEKSITFYQELFEEEPTTITDDRWADWRNNNNNNNKVYFGIISKEVIGEKLVSGNNGVLGLYTSNLDTAFEKCKKIGAKILYEPENVPNSKDNYKCFAIEDLDGNKIEIAYYDK